MTRNGLKSKEEKIAVVKSRVVDSIPRLLVTCIVVLHVLL